MDGFKLKSKIEISYELIDAIAQRVIEITKPRIIQIEPPEVTYTVNEVAKMLDKDQTTVRRHIKNGLLVATKNGKSFTITQTNFNNYINGKY